MWGHLMIGRRLDIGVMGTRLSKTLNASLGDSLRDSLGASLRGSLGDRLWASLYDSLWVSLIGLNGSLVDSIDVGLHGALDGR